MASSADVDIRIDTSRDPYPEEGRFKHFVISRKIDIPALITAGTLTASGLIYTSGTYKYYMFNLPKYCIVKGAWIFVRTVEATGPTGTVTVYANTTAITSTHLLTTLGTILSSGWSTGSTPLAFNTGAGTDMISIVVLTASLVTAIFDVCVEVIKGDQGYNAGSLSGSTGQ